MVWVCSMQGYEAEAEKHQDLYRQADTIGMNKYVKAICYILVNCVLNDPDKAMEYL